MTLSRRSPRARQPDLRRLSPPRLAVALAATLAAAAAGGCGAAGPPGPQSEAPVEGEEAATAAAAGAVAERPAWALAIHGGAGVIPRTMGEEAAAGYRRSLESALALGRERLAAGASALDTVEEIVRRLEDDPLFNAGRGAVYTRQGEHELDAAIMDGRDLSVGAVAAVTTVKNPISLARRVMERTDHILLFGAGAESFAAAQGLELVPTSYFDTERRRRQLDEKLAEEKAAAAAAAGSEGGAPAEPELAGRETGTVGAVALDRDGHLAAATSTGGLTAKLWGRVGDTPIPGAGTWADDRTAAISCTGKGEQFIRHAVAHEVAARMAHRGLGLEEAAREVIHFVLDQGDGGLVAVGRDGSIALVFNSPGMFRGAADAGGRFEVAIWDE